MDREYIHPSHDVDLFWDVPDPHNPAWQCRFCHLVTCGAGCPPGEGMDDEELAAECAKAPADRTPPPQPIPLKIVRDEIAAPPGTTTIQFSAPGIMYLPGGNAFQLASSSITLTYGSSAVITAKQAREMKELADLITELVRQGSAPLDTFGNLIQAGIPLGPAVPARQDNPG